MRPLIPCSLATVLALGALGCSHLERSPVASRGAAALSAQARPASGRTTGPGWYAVQLHAHSTYSDGVFAPRDMIAMGKDAGLDALGISDHDTATHWLDPAVTAERDLVMLRSMEVEDAAGINHMGLHGMGGMTAVPHGPRDEMLAQATARGGTIVINHPANSKEPWAPMTFDARAHAVEVWNAWFWVPLAGEEPTPIGTRPGHGPEKSFRHNERAIAWWAEQLGRGVKVAAIAAADFHRKPQKVGSPCTLVWSEGRSQAQILAGIRAGHTNLADSPRSERVELTADADGDGRFEAIVGDSVPAGATLRVHVTGGQGRDLQIMRGDKRLQRIDVPGQDYATEFKLPTSGAPFVYARLNSSTAPGSVLRAMTSALYLR